MNTPVSEKVRRLVLPGLFQKTTLYTVSAKSKGAKVKDVIVINGLASAKADLTQIARALKQRYRTGGIIKTGLFLSREIIGRPCRLNSRIWDNH